MFCATTMATPYRIVAALLLGEAFLEGLVSRSIHPMPSFPGLQVLATKNFWFVWHESPYSVEANFALLHPVEPACT